jgi:hypothetical protein
VDTAASVLMIDPFGLADSLNSLLLKATLTSFYPCDRFGQTPNNACAKEALV